MEPSVLMGPLITDEAVDGMTSALQVAIEQGGNNRYGWRSPCDTSANLSNLQSYVCPNRHRSCVKKPCADPLRNGV